MLVFVMENAHRPIRSAGNFRIDSRSNNNSNKEASLAAAEHAGHAHVFAPELPIPLSLYPMIRNRALIARNARKANREFDAQRRFERAPRSRFGIHAPVRDRIPAIGIFFSLAGASGKRTGNGLSTKVIRAGNAAAPRRFTGRGL